MEFARPSPSPRAVPARLDSTVAHSMPSPPISRSPASSCPLSDVQTRNTSVHQPSPSNEDRSLPRRPIRPTLMTHQYSEPIPMPSSTLSPVSPTMTHQQAANNALFTVHRTPLLPMSSPLTGSAHSSTPFSPSSAMSGSTHFGVYPGSLPSNPHNYSQPSFATSLDSTEEVPGVDLDFDMGLDLDFDGLDDFDDLMDLSMPTMDMIETKPSNSASVTSSPNKKLKPRRTPRPPNAWILYRSDKLRAIAAGEPLPNLDELLAETGVGGSASGSSGEENSSVPSKNLTAGTSISSQVPSPGDGEANNSSKMPPPAVPVKKKRIRKGMKEPTEGMLALGRGKTGRGLPQADISKMISLLWKRESQEIRVKYENLSELKKLEHQKKYPGYKFQPLRKADKIKMREEKEQERQAIKREKEIAQANNAARPRRSRARARVSPSSPYSNSLEKRPILLGRSASYSGTRTADGVVAGSSMFFAGLPGQPVPFEPEQPEDNAFRSYPFPMPSSSLPSMKPEDHPNYPGYVEEINAGFLVDSSSTPAVSSVHSSPLKPRKTIHPSSMSESSTKEYSFPLRQSWMGPPPVPLPHHTIPTTPDVPESGSASNQPLQGPTMNLLHTYNPDSVPETAWTEDVQDTGPAFAVPYIFEPIPLPGEEQPTPAAQSKALEGIPSEPNGIESLAATWCLIEDDDNPVVPIGQGTKPKCNTDTGSSEGVMPGGEDVPAMVPMGLQVGSIPSNPAGGLITIPEGVFQWETEGASAAEQWGSLDAQPEDLEVPAGRSSIAVQIVGGFVTTAVPMNIGPGGSHVVMCAPQGVFDPSSGYLSVPFGELEGHSSLGTGAGVNPDDSLGPFFTVQQPLSPMDSWSVGPSTPRDPRDHLLRPTSQSNSTGGVEINMGMNSTLMHHRASIGSVNSAFSPTDPTIPRITSSTYNPTGPAPRHISASAYPTVHLGMGSDQIGGMGVRSATGGMELSGGGMGIVSGWNERQLSLSHIPDMGGEFGMMSAEELIGGEDDKELEHSTRVQSTTTSRSDRSIQQESQLPSTESLPPLIPIGGASPNPPPSPFPSHHHEASQPIPTQPIQKMSNIPISNSSNSSMSASTEENKGDSSEWGMLSLQQRLTPTPLSSSSSVVPSLPMPGQSGPETEQSKVHPIEGAQLQTGGDSVAPESRPIPLRGANAKRGRAVAAKFEPEP